MKRSTQSPEALLLPFDSQASRSGLEALGEGAALLYGFAQHEAANLVDSVLAISGAAPFRHMSVRGGFKMSVAMTNCGSLGWVSDESGYRYDTHDPLTGCAWPGMPEVFEKLARTAAAAAGFPNFNPDACLINRYEPGAQMGLHQDKNESDMQAPIVSVSLGLPATFLFGGMRRNETPRRFQLLSGDVVVWGGPSRLAYHGVARLRAGAHPLTGNSRINLTFRSAA